MNKKIAGWISYDFANSSFTTVIVTVVYSVYFKTIVVGQSGVGDSLWGFSVSLSMIVVALLSPILGAIADYGKTKKRFLLLCCYTSVVFTGLLYFVRPGMIVSGMAIFIVANIGYECGNVFYNAFLPEITTEKNIGKISGLGWGIGYIGGLLSLVLIYPLINISTVLIFPMVALFFGIFALPIFLFLPEKQNKSAVQSKKYIHIAYLRLKDTIKHIRTFKELTTFLVSFFLYNDGIKTIIVFAAIYGTDRFNMKMDEITIYFIIANVFSFIGAILFGYVVDAIGAKKTISITLLLWIAVILWAFWCSSIMQFYGIGVLAGIAIGASQSASRSLFALLTPKDKEAEFFGFYGMSGKAAAIIGPALFGFLVFLFNSQRVAILSVMIFFILGFLLLQKVNVDEGKKQALAFRCSHADRDV